MGGRWRLLAGLASLVAGVASAAGLAAPALTSRRRMRPSPFRLAKASEEAERDRFITEGWWE